MSRSSIWAPHRWLIASVLVLLAALTFLFLRGPDAWQRLYYPLPDDHRPAILASADRHEVNPYLVAGVIWAESSWDSQSVSDAGAVGLMQLMPGTAAELDATGIVDEGTVAGVPLSDPSANIEYGCAYLRHLVERYHEIETALAAYNAGITNVDEWVEEGSDIREEIEFPETRHFVLRVMRARDVYEELYPDAFEREAEQ